MPPITWRNVEMDSNAAANQLMSQGIASVNKGLQGFGDVVAAKDKLNIDNWNAGAKLNTDQASATLDSAKTVAELDALTSTGAALNADTLTGKFGAKIDAAALLKTAAAKRTDLLKTETLDSRNVIKDQAEKEKNASDLENAKLLREQTKLSINKLNQEFTLFKENARLTKDKRDLEDKLEYQIQGIFKSTPDKDLALQNVQLLLNDTVESSKGLFGLADMSRVMTTASSVDPRVSEVFTKELTETKTKVDLASADVERRVSTLIQEYATHEGVDPSVIPHLTDKTPRETVTDNLAKEIEGSPKQKGATKDFNKNAVSYAYTRVEKALQSKLEGTITVTPKMVGAVLSASGYESTVFYGDSEYVVNDDIISEYASKWIKGRDFATAGAENIREIQKEGVDAIALLDKEYKMHQQGIKNTAWIQAFNNQSDASVFIAENPIKKANPDVTHAGIQKRLDTLRENLLGITAKKATAEEKLKKDAAALAEANRVRKIHPGSNPRGRGG
jgi:hypothetical protein